MNGMIVFSSDTTEPYSIGTTATHSCDSGFVLSGSSERTCMQDDQEDAVGVWTNSAPACERKLVLFCYLYC